MKKISVIFVAFLFLFLQTGNAAADKEELQFSIQKIKNDIEKGQKKSEEMKLSVPELQKARNYLKQAETELTKNKNWRGVLNKDAEPLISHLTETAEVYTAIAFSRMGKADQERENDRLEKQIPQIEAKIKIFDDKNAEIQKLKAELEKPQGNIRDVSSEITGLKKEKMDLADQVSQLKAEKEKFSGKVETLNEMIAAVRKDLSERIKTVENISAENKLLKETIKNTETQKGTNLLAMQTKLNLADAKLKLFSIISKIGLISKVSGDELAFIIPRAKLIKTGPKSPALAPDAELYIGEIAAGIKDFPEAKLSVKVHGFGKISNEDGKGTTLMANLLKKAFSNKGIDETSIQATGVGTAALLFSKTAVEENRCVEITVSNLAVTK